VYVIRSHIYRSTMRNDGSQSSCRLTSTVTWRRMKHPGVTSAVRRTRTRRGMQPSSKCVDTRYVFSLPVSERTRVIYPAVLVKFADLSEYGYGVAILSESKYGFSCRGSVLRISLLRAATAPDAEQDQGLLRLSLYLPLRVKQKIFTQASMNFRGLYCPIMDTSSNRTSPSQLTSLILRYTVRRHLRLPV